MIGARSAPWHGWLWRLGDGRTHRLSLCRTEAKRLRELPFDDWLAARRGSSRGPYLLASSHPISPITPAHSRPLATHWRPATGQAVLSLWSDRARTRRSFAALRLSGCRGSDHRERLTNTRTRPACCPSSAKLATTFRAIADVLNACGVRTAHGGQWYAASVRNALEREHR